MASENVTSSQVAVALPVHAQLLIGLRHEEIDDGNAPMYQVSLRAIAQTLDEAEDSDGGLNLNGTYFVAQSWP